MSDEPRGTIEVTLDRDDVNNLMKDGTTIITKEAGPIDIRLKTHQHLHAVVMVSGRNKDPEPEIVDNE